MGSSTKENGKEMAEFDLQLYLKLTGADDDVKIGDKPDLELLKRLVKYHERSVFYQNYDLLMTRSEVDLSPPALLQRLLVEQKGGMCYESSELMIHVLKEFGFDAKRVPVFTTVHGQDYYEGSARSHNFILVDLQGKKYLVDVTFVFNSIREPLEFSFESTEERAVIPGVEEYRLECFEDHYMLHMWLNGGWGKMYHIKRPLPFLDIKGCLEFYRHFLITEDHVFIRDSVLKIGKVTEDGRLGFSCTFDRKSRPPFVQPYTKVLAKNKQAARIEKLSYESFKDGIEQNFHITLNGTLIGTE